MSQPDLSPANDEFDEEAYLQSEGGDLPPTSTAVALDIALRIAWVAAWLWLVITVGILSVAALSALGMDLPVGDLFGAPDLRPDGPPAGSNSVTGPLYLGMPIAVMLLASLALTVGAASFVIIVSQLRKVARTLRSGDPFVPINAKRLRTIWITVTVAELIRIALVTAISAYVVRAGNLTFANSWIGDFTGLNGGVMEIYVRWSVWLFVLILIALAQVFREGARLRRDQKLTV